jgi:hypothetical protein
MHTPAIVQQPFRRCIRRERFITVPQNIAMCEVKIPRETRSLGMTNGGTGIVDEKTSATRANAIRPYNSWENFRKMAYSLNIAGHRTRKKHGGDASPPYNVNPVN